MIWVKVRVAAQEAPLHFLLDSGAGASVLDLNAARRLGVKLGRGESVQGVGGHATAYRIDDLHSSVGSVAGPRSFLALDLSGVSAGMHRRIDGLLGTDFFRGRIVQIDYALRTLRLLDRAELNASEAEVLRLSRRNDAMCVSVSVAGQKADWLRLDTGCRSAVEWVAVKRKTDALARTSIGAATGSKRSITAKVVLGSARFSDIKIGVHPQPIFAGEAGLLGNGLLSRFVVTVDADRSRLLLVRIE